MSGNFTLSRRFETFWCCFCTDFWKWYPDNINVFTLNQQTTFAASPRSVYWTKQLTVWNDHVNKMCKLKILVKSTTVCPRSSDQFYIVSYYIKCVTISWTYSKLKFIIKGIIKLLHSSICISKHISTHFF